MITHLDIESAGRLPSWSEIRIALDRGWISPAVAVQVAAEAIESSESSRHLALLSELATANPNDPIAALVAELASTDAPASAKAAKQFWARAALINLWAHRGEIAEPLRAVSDLYCEFDHPEEWYEFIYYHPAKPGYDPSAHSSEENLARLVRLWGEHVESLRASAGLVRPNST